jgi:hypothetical protein
MQELGQADISTILKSHLKDRLAVLRKAFDKEVKDQETAATKAVSISYSVAGSFLIYFESGG